MNEEIELAKTKCEEARKLALDEGSDAIVLLLNGTKRFLDQAHAKPSAGRFTEECEELIRYCENHTGINTAMRERLRQACALLDVEVAKNKELTKLLQDALPNIVCENNSQSENIYKP